MNINYEYYRIFYYVVIYQNITRASIKLNISQPAISKTIKLLEDQLNTKLFIRSNRGVILTSQGRMIFNDIKSGIEHFENVENIINEFNELKKGKIAIGASTTVVRYFLFPFLDKFHNKYPNIEIILDTDPTNKLIDKLKNGILDIVFLTNNFNDKNYKLINCIEIHDSFFTSDYELSKKTIKLKDINNYKLILQSEESNTRKHLDNLCFENNILLNPILDLSSFTLMVDFVKKGYGIGFGTIEFLKKEINDKEIYTMKIDKKIKSRKINALYKSNIKSNILNEFIRIFSSNE